MGTGQREHVLVIRSGGLGDFVLCLPVLRALRLRWPGAHIEILGKPGVAEIACGRFYVDHVTSLDESRFAALFGEAPLPAHHPSVAFLAGFDLVVSFLGTPESRFAQRLIAAAGEVVLVPPPRAGARHASRHFLDALAPLGVKADNCLPEVFLTEEDRGRGRTIVARALGSESDRPILVHPGSGGRDKNWFPACFADIIRRFLDSGARVILLKGEADEQAAYDVMLRLGHRVIPILTDLEVIDVARALSASRLLVGNDSGISHLAAAVGTPVVCLFGPTDPAVWAPAGARTKVITFGEATPERVCLESSRLLRI